MIEIIINLTWILREQTVRSQMFVEYGLGQMKLEIEHRKSSDGSDKDYTQYLEDFLSTQRYPFLTTVTIGNWADSDLRTMAA